jgi:hypothetical protein
MVIFHRYVSLPEGMEHGGFILWYSKSYGKAASLDILKRSIILNHPLSPAVRGYVSHQRVNLDAACGAW